MPKTKKLEKKEKPLEDHAPLESNEARGKTKRKVKKPIIKKAVTGPRLSPSFARTQAVKKPAPKAGKYYEAEGRRKTAVARIRLFTSKAKIQEADLRHPARQVFLVNKKPLEQYFPIFELQQTAQSSLERMKCLDKFRVSARVQGGGLSGQAEAIRHGIARALVLFNPDFRKRLKAAGFLTRDPRMRERKKFGLKRARRAPQWSKR